MMSWLTVARMMQVKGGFRSPEDVKKTLLNPDPSAEQLAPNEYVDRIRRIQLNDLENLPFFPGCRLSLHPDRAAANARSMAAVWLRRFAAVTFRGLLSPRGLTIRARRSGPSGSLILIFMSCWTLFVALASVNSTPLAP